MNWDREKEKKAGKAYHVGFSVFGLVFAIFWCIAAASMGAGIMLIFGIPFVGLMAFRLVMISKHGDSSPKSKTTTQADPWEQQTPHRRENGSGNGFCPYCGSGVEESFAYCPKCGRNLQ